MKLIDTMKKKLLTLALGAFTVFGLSQEAAAQTPVNKDKEERKIERDESGRIKAILDKNGGKIVDNSHVIKTEDIIVDGKKVGTRTFEAAYLKEQKSTTATVGGKIPNQQRAENIRKEQERQAALKKNNPAAYAAEIEAYKKNKAAIDSAFNARNPKYVGTGTLPATSENVREAEVMVITERYEGEKEVQQVIVPVAILIPYAVPVPVPFEVPVKAKPAFYARAGVVHQNTYGPKYDYNADQLTAYTERYDVIDFPQTGVMAGAGMKFGSQQQFDAGFELLMFPGRTIPFIVVDAQGDRGVYDAVLQTRTLSNSLSFNLGWEPEFGTNDNRLTFGPTISLGVTGYGNIGVTSPDLSPAQMDLSNKPQIFPHVQLGGQTHLNFGKGFSLGSRFNIKALGKSRQGLLGNEHTGLSVHRNQFQTNVNLFLQYRLPNKKPR